MKLIHNVASVTLDFYNIHELDMYLIEGKTGCVTSLDCKYKVDRSSSRLIIII